MVSRPKCQACRSGMVRIEARVRLEGDDRPMSMQTRKPVGWICKEPGCGEMVRTWFSHPISPP